MEILFTIIGIAAIVFVVLCVMGEDVINAIRTIKKWLKGKPPNRPNPLDDDYDPHNLDHYH